MKQLILTLAFSVLFTATASATQVNLNDVKKHLGNSSTVNIVPLWEKLGIVNQKELFNCGPQERKCLVTDFKINTIGHKDIKVLQLTKLDYDYQYLFFKRSGSNYLFFDHLEYPLANSLSEITFLEDDLITMKNRSASGTGISEATTEAFQVTDNKLKKLLSFISSATQAIGPDAPMVEINSKTKYVNKVFRIEYEINISMPEEISDKPFVHENKVVVFVRKPEGFILDQSQSNTTPAAIESLLSDYSNCYLMFKNQFDALEKKSPEAKKWLESFKQEIKK